MKTRLWISIFTGCFFLFFQSSNYANSNVQILGVKPDFLFIFLIYLGFNTRAKTFLVAAFSAGLACDMLSNGVMGFSVFTYYVSLLPLLWVKKWVSAPAAPVFMLIVFIISLLRGILECTLIAAFFDASYAGGYFQSTVLLQVMLQTVSALPMLFVFSFINNLLHKREMRHVQMQ